MNRRLAVSSATVLAMAASTTAQQVHVFPDLPSTGSNFTPFSVGSVTFHHVFASSMFADVSGGAPISIEAIAFSPLQNRSFDANIVINFGYTNAIPGEEPFAGGLDTPILGTPGAPNAVGPMHPFYENPFFSQTFTSASGTNFQMVFEGTAFEYDPGQGNLLLEIIADLPSGNLSVPTVNAGNLASRAVNSTRIPTTTHPHISHLVEFTFEIGGDPCYANCDGSTTEPILTVDDFTCFINEFAAAQSLPPAQQIEHYANCDGSTTEPILTVDDFTCFINAFAQGCP